MRLFFKNIKEQIKKTPALVYFYLLIKNINRKWKYSIDPPQKWIERIFDNTEIMVVQIGSNDGTAGDPIFDLIKKNDQWKVLFVEPVPKLFNKLIENYGNEHRFKFENSAINDGDRQVFYSVKEEAKNFIANLPFWYDQINSFDKNHILKHLNGALEPFIQETLILGLTLNDLLRKYEINRIDILQIDTEGYDWKILSQLDLNTYKPSMIIFEHWHLSKSEKMDAFLFLKKDYKIFETGMDFVCLLTS